jgi:hypothetical protein
VGDKPAPPEGWARVRWVDVDRLPGRRRICSRRRSPPHHCTRERGRSCEVSPRSVRDLFFVISSIFEVVCLYYTRSTNSTFRVPIALEYFIIHRVRLSIIPYHPSPIPIIVGCIQSRRVS